MILRCDGFLTGAIVIAAAMAVACSDGNQRQAREAPAPRPAGQQQAVPTTYASEAVTPEEGPPAADPGPVRFADGEAAYHARDYAEAAHIFARYVDERPENAWGHFMLGLSAWKLGDLERAESAFEAALRIDATHVKSLVNLGRVLLDARRPAEALDRLDRAADLQPRSAEVHRLLGRTHRALGRTEEAIDAYLHAIELDPRDSWALNNLGLLFLEEDRAADALPLLARAVELRRDVPAFQNNLGMALEHTGRYAAAAEAYGDALAADPGHEKAARNLARVEQIGGSRGEPFDLEATAGRVAEVVALRHEQP